MHRTSLPRAFVGLAAAFFAVTLITAPAAFAAGQDRISGNIANGARAEIADSVHPRARAATDLGPTAGDTKLGMSLRFSMTAAQSSALDQLLAAQQNPASPFYHQWLTPAQFAAQFGLSQNDLAKVTSWLTAQGFTVTGVANGGLFVAFDGTVAQAEAAFDTSIHNVQSNGETHFANITSVSVPTVLAGVVGGVTGLHNFLARPHVGVAAHPQFTSSASGNHFLAPGDVNVIYDMKPLLAGFNGTGITIAVTGQVDINTTDVSAFRSAAGLSTTNLPTIVHPVLNSVTEDPGPAVCTSCTTGPNALDLEESSLDAEWSGAMAPSASVIFVSSACGTLPGGLCGEDSMTWAIDNNLAPIVTTSYGNPEAAWGSTDLNASNTLFKQAAAQGQTVIAASGDSGATDADAGVPATEGLTVDFPASSPYVLALGGTMFNGDAEATGSGTTWAATQYWAGTSGSDVVTSALSYIPEMVWNEDTLSDSLSAGGGGVSAYFPKPAWQVETGASGMTTTVPADASRDVPDIALNAAASHDSLLFCYTYTLSLTSSAYDPGCLVGFRETAGGTLTVAGGTSFDSQMFGGMLALIEQKVGSRLGIVTPTLYALGNNAAYYNSGSTSVFHDITAGNNNSPCTSGTPNCPGGTEGFSAATGYDLATGWGSVDLNNLATDWKLVTPLGLGSAGTSLSATNLTTTPTCNYSGVVNYSPCSVSAATGSSVTLTATVTGSASTPTGTVQFLANNAALGSPVTLNASGTATYTYNATCTSLGQQMMTAVYSGDANYAGSKGPALPTGTPSNIDFSANGSLGTNPLIVTVTSSSCPDFSVAPSGTSTGTATILVSGTNASVSVSAGGAIPPLTITVAPLNGFVGTVSFASSSTSTSGYTPTVTFSSPSLTFTASSSASQTTTVSLSGITADLRMPVRPGESHPGRPWYMAGSGVAAASLFLLVFPRRRRLGGLLAIALAVSLAVGATGCGGSSQQVVSGGGGSTNPYVGTYVVTVMATYSSSGQTITHSSTITYNIN